MAESPLVTPQLIEMWRNNLRKSVVQPTQRNPLAGTKALAYHFGGGTIALTAGQTGLIEVPFPGTLLAVHLFAGSALFVPVAVTTTVDLVFASQGNWSGGMTPLHAGTLPGMTVLSEGVITDLTGWTTALTQGDLIGCRVVTFTGTATFLLVSLIVQEIPVKGIGVFDLVDDAGDSLVDDNGNPIVWRS
jgi:hypothetical protein